MIYETYLKFSKINKTAGHLLIPYLAWVGFAAILNASIWWLNR
jgi:benzodiazapine receptor